MLEHDGPDGCSSHCEQQKSPLVVNESLSAFLRNLLGRGNSSENVIVSDNAAGLPDHLSQSINAWNVIALHSSVGSLPELSRWDSHVVTSPMSDRLEMTMPLRRPQRRGSEDGLPLVPLDDSMMRMELSCLRRDSINLPQEHQTVSNAAGKNETNKHALPPKVPIRRSSSHRTPSPPPFDPNQLSDDDDNDIEDDLDGSFAISESDTVALPYSLSSSTPPKAPIRRSSLHTRPSPSPSDPAQHNDDEANLDRSSAIAQSAAEKATELTSCPAENVLSVTKSNSSDESFAVDSQQGLTAKSVQSDTPDSINSLKYHGSWLAQPTVFKEGGKGSSISDEFQLKHFKKIEDTMVGPPSLECIPNPPHRRSMKLERLHATRSFERSVLSGFGMQRRNATRKFAALDLASASDFDDAVYRGTRIGINTAPQMTAALNPHEQEIHMSYTRLSSSQTLLQRQQEIDLVDVHTPKNNDEETVSGSKSKSNSSGANKEHGSAGTAPVTLQKVAERTLLGRIKKHIRPKKHKTGN